MQKSMSTRNFHSKRVGSIARLNSRQFKASYVVIVLFSFVVFVVLDVAFGIMVLARKKFNATV